MTSSRLASLIFGSFLTLALASAPAMAGTRSAVSLAGSDVGTCPLTAPCRTLAYALTQTSPGGEILVKDSAGFGPITITQAVVIVAPPGQMGFISAPAGDAVTVNAGPNDIVILTNIFLEGSGTGGNGVTVNSTGSFSFSGTITGFTGNAINYVNSNPGNNQKLTIGSSSLYNNTGGVLLKPAAGTGLFASIRSVAFSTSGVVVDNTVATNCKIGVLFDNSILRYNGGTAVTVNSGGVSGIFANVYLDKSQIFNVNTGLVANGAGAFILMNDSSAVNVSTLVGTGTGSVKSIGNNMISVATIGALGSQAPQ